MREEVDKIISSCYNDQLKTELVLNVQEHLCVGMVTDPLWAVVARFMFLVVGLVVCCEY